MRSCHSPHTPGTHDWASSGDWTAATGLWLPRSSGERPEFIDSAWNGLSAPPWRSVQRASHPGAGLIEMRPVSQKCRLLKCERSGFA